MAIEQMALLIPILGIVLGVGVAVVAIIASHREKQKRAELRHRERLAAIEKGIELLPDPDPDAEPKKGSSLKGGLVGLFLGVVLYFALREVAGEDVALFGLVPAAIGVASLISYFVEGRRKPAS
jgi:cadmium resistance protein CadD (predicted permease)